MERNKMSRENRAKQFMPFAALKGYEEALEQKEIPCVPKIELSEEAQEELNHKLQQVSVNDMVYIEYYSEHQYFTISGMVSEINTTFRYMMVEEVKIPLDDIYDVEPIE